MGGVAHGVSFVLLYQETAVPGPLAVVPCAFPVHAEDLSFIGLHLKVKEAHHVLPWEGQPSRMWIYMGQGVSEEIHGLEVTQVISILNEDGCQNTCSP